MHNYKNKNNKDNRAFKPNSNDLSPLARATTSAETNKETRGTEKPTDRIKRNIQPKNMGYFVRTQYIHNLTRRDSALVHGHLPYSNVPLSFSPSIHCPLSTTHKSLLSEMNLQSMYMCNMAPDIFRYSAPVRKHTHHQ